MIISCELFVLCGGGGAERVVQSRHVIYGRFLSQNLWMWRCRTRTQRERGRSGPVASKHSLSLSLSVQTSSRLDNLSILFSLSFHRLLRSTFDYTWNMERCRPDIWNTEHVQSSVPIDTVHVQPTIVSVFIATTTATETWRDLTDGWLLNNSQTFDKERVNFFLAYYSRDQFIIVVTKNHWEHGLESGQLFFVSFRYLYQEVQ